MARNARLLIALDGYYQIFMKRGIVSYLLKVIYDFRASDNEIDKKYSMRQKKNSYEYLI